MIKDKMGFVLALSLTIAAGFLQELTGPQLFVYWRSKLVKQLTFRVYSFGKNAFNQLTNTDKHVHTYKSQLRAHTRMSKLGGIVPPY